MVFSLSMCFDYQLIAMAGTQHLEYNCFLFLADRKQLTDAMLSANKDLRHLAMEGSQMQFSFLLRFFCMCGLS
jgi:hypothetical protein